MRFNSRACNILLFGNSVPYHDSRARQGMIKAFVLLLYLISRGVSVWEITSQSRYTHALEVVVVPLVGHQFAVLKRYDVGANVVEE